MYLKTHSIDLKPKKVFQDPFGLKKILHTNQSSKAIDLLAI